jgi:hypothetical protein
MAGTAQLERPTSWDRERLGEVHRALVAELMADRPDPMLISIYSAKVMAYADRLPPSPEVSLAVGTVQGCVSAAARRGADWTAAYRAAAAQSEAVRGRRP